MDQPFVLLLRALNVGGHSTLTMAALRTLAEQAGLGGVATYIQSGNLTVRQGTPDALAGFSARLGEALGHQPFMVCLTRSDLEAVIRDNPFQAEAQAAPARVHAYVGQTAFEDTSFIDQARTLAAGQEQVAAAGQTVYLSAPDGIGRSKLAAATEQLAGVPLTARSLKTLLALKDRLAG